jgi:hypothetical protein
MKNTGITFFAFIAFFPFPFDPALVCSNTRRMKKFRVWRQGYFSMQRNFFRGRVFEEIGISSGHQTWKQRRL